MPDTSYENWVPKTDQTAKEYGAALAADGKRELEVRKALRCHFDLEIAEVIALCNDLPAPRLLEIQILRERFPDATQKRFAWRIKKTMTVDPAEAEAWADKIFTAEAEAS